MKLLGRPMTVATKRAEVTFFLDCLEASPSQLELALGHLGEVRASASNVVWNGRRVDHLDVTAKNVHVRPGPQATLVAAPVGVTASVSQACLDGWVDSWQHAELTLVEGGVAVMRRGKEQWGSVEVEPRVGASEITFVPRALSLRSRRIEAPRRLPPLFRLRLPPMPYDLLITKTQVSGQVLVVTGVVPEIRYPIDPNQLQRLDQLARGGEGRFSFGNPVEREDDQASP